MGPPLSVSHAQPPGPCAMLGNRAPRSPANVTRGGSSVRAIAHARTLASALSFFFFFAANSACYVAFFVGQTDARRAGAAFESERVVGCAARYPVPPVYNTRHPRTTGAAKASAQRETATATGAAAFSATFPCRFLLGGSRSPTR